MPTFLCYSQRLAGATAPARSYLPLMTEQCGSNVAIAIDNSVDITLPSHIYQVCAIVIVVSELCAAGANFGFHIGDETKVRLIYFSRLQRLLYASLKSSSMPFFGGGKQGTLCLGGASLKGPPWIRQCIRFG